MSIGVCTEVRHLYVRGVCFDCGEKEPQPESHSHVHDHVCECKKCGELQEAVK